MLSLRCVGIVPKQTTCTRLTQPLNQSACLYASDSCLIDALIQSLSTAALWSTPKANTTHKSSMSWSPTESGAGLTEHLWTIDQEEKCTHLWPGTTRLSSVMGLQDMRPWRKRDRLFSNIFTSLTAGPFVSNSTEVMTSDSVKLEVLVTLVQFTDYSSHGGGFQYFWESIC